MLLQRLYDSVVGFICRDCIRHPWRWLLFVLLVSVPAAVAVSHVGIDTNLIRLLPLSSPTAALTRQLEPVVGDGGHFTLMLEGSDRQKLLSAVRAGAERAAALPEVDSVQYRWPVDFFRTWRYLLIPNDYLRRMTEEVSSWEAQVNPFVENLDDQPAAKTETVGDREDREDLKISLRYYTSLTEYHESSDGQVMGMIIRTRQGVTNIGEIERLFGKLQSIGKDLTRTYGVWSGVGGSHRNKLDEIAIIRSDLGRAGTFSSLLIGAVIFLSFRSLPALILVFLPMGLGILWSFALVPATVGDFNLLTAFIVGVMLGLGVENSIYLVKDFQKELQSRSLEEALLQTYRTTGPSVIISGLTTGFSLLLLRISSFRGFSEYGLIGFMSIFMIMLSMFVVLPPILVMSHRWRLLAPYRVATSRPPQPHSPVTVVLLGLLVAAAVAAALGTGFDYNFRNLQIDRKKVGDSQEVRDRQNRVYAGSYSPGAVYLVDGFPAADRLGALLAASREKPGSTVGRVRSLRDLVPPPAQLAERHVLLDDLAADLGGRWTEKIKDADQRRLIDEFRVWKTPPGDLTTAEIPETIRRPFLAKDGSGRLVLTIHPSVDRKDARNAMAFARELNALPAVPGARGPIGETVVFAEILKVVLAEGPILVMLTLLLVFAIVFVYQRSIRETLIILFPLIGGVVLSLGVLVAAGLKLNFFNIVVIPSLLGMGVDSGVHYFRRWHLHEGNVAAVQAELFEPMTIANWTTAIGFGGMLFANHPGVRSIGMFAVIGCLCAWVTNLFLFPGVLSWLSLRRRGSGGGNGGPAGGAAG